MNLIVSSPTFWSSRNAVTEANSVILFVSFCSESFSCFSCSELCKDLFNEWSELDNSRFSVETVSGGITNLRECLLAMCFFVQLGERKIVFEVAVVTDFFVACGICFSDFCSA